MPLQINDTLCHDRYRIDALLGQGGMGSVYKGWDFNLEMPVAIKENLNLSPEAQKQFNREAGMLARLTHAHLPRVTDYFTIPDQGQYLVMDYIEGEDLNAMLHRLGFLPEDQVLIWIGQVADALHYLHNQEPPIIHRDIKPSNIRVRKDGRAVLVDFGIAKMMGEGKATTVGARAVTPGYSPPEQYGGGHTDRRSDVYALGATLYHLLTGKEPPESVQRVVNLAEMPAPRQINQAISPQVEQVILKSVEVETNRRFQSIEELQASLKVGSTEATIANPSGASAQGPAVPLASPPLQAPAIAPLGAPLTGLPGPEERAAQSSPSNKRTGLIIAGALLAVFLLALFIAGGLFAAYRIRSGTSATQAVAVLATAAPTLAPSPSPTISEPVQVIKPTEAPPTATLPPPGPAKEYAIVGRLVAPNQQLIRSVAAKDGYAYMLTKQSNLLTYDLTAMNGGQEMQTYDQPINSQVVQNNMGMLRSGQTLYIYGGSGYEIVDLTQPDKPVWMSQQKGIVAINMIISAPYMIIMGTGLLIVNDITQPLHPAEIKKLQMAAGVTNFAGVVNQDRLYVSEYFTTDNNKAKGLLKVYDFTVPAQMKEIQRIDTGELAYQLLIVDDHLVRCTSTDVELWDLADRTVPRFLSSMSGRARACLADQSNIIINGAVFTLGEETLLPLTTFDANTGLASAPTAYELYPYGTTTDSSFVLLSQPNQVLILAGK